MTSGSYWFKCDLQVHTPLDRWSDFVFATGAPSEQEKVAWSKKLIETAVSKKLELIAITEHNDGSYLDYVIKGGKSKGVGVIPGVEVSSLEGIHILALFDAATDLQKHGCRNWQEFIDHFLSSIGVPKPRFVSRQPQRANKPVQQILEAVDVEGGICIFPHALGNNGGMERMTAECLLGYSTGDAKKGIYKNPLCRIVQIPNTISDLSQGDRLIVTGGNSDFGKKVVACINTSDTRSFANLGSKYCWIKAAPTFEGLKQIMYEPVERVFIGDQAPQYLHTQVTSLKSSNTDGSESYCIPQDVEIHLSPNLNVLIGGRGTGKTTALESLGFVFDQYIDGKQFGTGGPQAVPLIRKTIEELQDLDGELSILKVGSKYGQDLSESERVLDLESQKPSIGFGIEYWPQGEIEKYAYDARKLKKLLQPLLQDKKFVDIEEEISGLLDQARGLTGKYSDIGPTKDRLFKAREKLGVHKRLLLTVKDAAFQDLISNMSKLSEEKAKLDNAIGSITNHVNQISDFLDDREMADADVVDWPQLLVSCGLTGSAITTPDKLIQQLKDGRVELGALEKRILDSKHYKDTAVELTKVQGDYAKVANDLGLKLTQQQVAESSGQIVVLEQEIAGLEQKITTLDESIEKHAELIGKIKIKREALGSIRKLKFQEISTELGEGALIEDGEKTDEDLVLEAFSSLAGKSNLRTREMVSALLQLTKIEDIIISLQSETVPKVIDGQFPGTSDWFFVSKEFRNRKLLEMKLKEIVPVFSPSVTQDGKRLEDLSFGERCALVLRIIISYGNEPVLIDQPEDHLDNEFITENLLKTLRKRKVERQIILATHNPNVVVNADAENVVVFQKPLVAHGKVQIVNGGLEDVKIRDLVAKILEGGRVAFKKREERYEF